MRNTFYPKDNGFYLKNINIEKDIAVFQICLNANGMKTANYLKNYMVGVYLKQNDQLWKMNSYITGTNELEAELYYETIAANIVAKPRSQAALYVRTRIGDEEYEHPVCVISDNRGFLIEFGLWNRFCLVPVSPWRFCWSKNLSLLLPDEEEPSKCDPEDLSVDQGSEAFDYKKSDALYIDIQGYHSSSNGLHFTFSYDDEGWPVRIESLLLKRVNTDIVFTFPVVEEYTDFHEKSYGVDFNLETYKHFFRIGIYQLFAVVYDGIFCMELPIKTFREVIPCENTYFVANPAVITVNGIYQNLLFYNDTSLNLKARLNPKYLRGQIELAKINGQNFEFSVKLQNEDGFTRPTAAYMLGSLSGQKDIPFQLLEDKRVHTVSLVYNLNDLYNQMPDEDICIALNYGDCGVLPIQNNWYGKRESGRENFALSQIEHFQGDSWYKVSSNAKQGVYTLRISEDLEIIALNQIEAREDSLEFVIQACENSGIGTEESIFEYDGQHATLLFISNDTRLSKDFLWNNGLGSITVSPLELPIAEYDLWCLFPDGKKSRIVMNTPLGEIYRNEEKKIITKKNNGKLNIAVVELLLYETTEKKEKYIAIAQNALDEQLDTSPPVWLIGENYGMSARDNGLAFFEYCLRIDISENVFYIIKQDSPDLDRLKPYKDHVLFYDSPEHIHYDAIAEFYIVSHGIRDVMPSLYHNNLTSGRKPVIYLQHGITAMKKIGMNYLSYGGAIDRFCVSSKFEGQLLEKNHQFYASEIVVSGFARFDQLDLSHRKSKCIWIMPTWRDWLVLSREDFLQSDFYKNYVAILNSPELLHAIQLNGYKIIFSLHIEFEKYKSYFDRFENENVQIVDIHQIDISTLVQECSMMITDYSSIAFDVLYMETPVFFFQFDRDLYDADRGSYIDLDEDLPGAVAKTPDEVVDYIIDCIHKNCVIEEKYKLRKEKFFDYHDSENSKRIYNSIIDCRKEHE